MTRVFFVLSHYLGMAQFGFGDALLHTPVIGWLKRVMGAVDVGCLPEIAWIMSRCSAVDLVIPVRSLADAGRAAGGRILIHSDFSIDEFPFESPHLNYTQTMAQRAGIPAAEIGHEPLDYRPTLEDRAQAESVLRTLGADRRALLTVNVRGRTRSECPGLQVDEYIRIAGQLARDFGALAIIGDEDVRMIDADVASVSVSLPVWTALIQRSSLWLGECTGPYHFAVALDTPTAMFSAAGMDNDAWRPAGPARTPHVAYVGMSGDWERQSQCVNDLRRLLSELPARRQTDLLSGS